jgi:beta-lactamase class D
MIALMVDLTVADAAAQSLTGEMRDSVVHYYKHLIEQIHGMKMADIEKNLQLLYANPALNGEIQKSLVDSIKLIDERWKQQILK